MIKVTCAKDGEKLSSIDLDSINEIVADYEKKVDRYLKNITSFEVHLKCFQKQGIIKRYYTNARVTSPKHLFDVSAEAWILRDCVKEAMNKLLSEIERKCHSSDLHGVHRASTKFC